MNNKKCQLCKNYRKDGYCEELGLKPVYPEGGCDYFEARMMNIQEMYDEIKDLSKRVETLENQIKEEKEERLKKLKAEIDYAKFQLESKPVDVASCAAEIFENQNRNDFLKKRFNIPMEKGRRC